MQQLEKDQVDPNVPKCTQMIDPEAGGWHWEKPPEAGPLWPGVERGSHSTSRGRRADQGTSRELRRLQKRFKLGRAYSDDSFLCFFFLY